MREEFDADYVDTITEPGPDKILSDTSDPLRESIRNRVQISVEKHSSQVIAVVSHGDCAGNPVSNEEHLRMVREAVTTVANWYPEIRIIGLWVDSDRWQVEKVCEQG
jgi:hypothetical protein